MASLEQLHGSFLEPRETGTDPGFQLLVTLWGGSFTRNEAYKCVRGLRVLQVLNPKD